MSRGLCEPYASLLHRLLSVAMERFGDRLISFVVYGSVARCEAGRDSDIDVFMVVEDPPRGRFRRQELFMEVEESVEEEVEELRSQGYNIDFSPIIKSVEEAQRISPLYLDMVEDAVILYDRGNFFSNILNRLRERLRELGAERVRLGRRWYWRLKKDYRFGEVIEL
ncbi:MAG: nucleotidyltransferase domain-containing protein [Ignisphaera sp.]|uniref:Nucleotidyltransferase domain-containing protein n=1 Tax=Ignisphaera aggregans TaxID=334771 RepID=A0A7J3JQI6_9CREN